MSEACAPLARPCKVCGNPADLFDVVDFHKNCQGPDVFPLSGVPVYYRRCGTCGFIFTEHFDDWSEADFKSRIYNEDYIKVDADYEEKRPAANTSLIEQVFGADKHRIGVLDYGGGNGGLAAGLRAAGFEDVTTYDPFSPDFSTRPDRQFDLITSFETLEHVPNPVHFATEISGLLADGGLVLFSTLLQPANIAEIRLSWWYAGPRNGHVSLFTAEALGALWHPRGYNVGSLNNGLHAAFRRQPSFGRIKFGAQAAG